MTPIVELRCVVLCQQMTSASGLARKAWQGFFGLWLGLALQHDLQCRALFSRHLLADEDVRPQRSDARDRPQQQDDGQGDEPDQNADAESGGYAEARGARPEQQGEQAGRQLQVVTIVRPTPNPSFRRIDAQVLDGDNSILRLSTIIGRY